MAVRIFHTMDEYVEHITGIENTSAATLVASSYLSSHLFPKNALIRYFAANSEIDFPTEQTVNNLWRRGRRIRSNMRVSTCNEIYEMDLFQLFCRNGIVHNQSPAFRATPNEIKEVLTQMLALLDRVQSYSLAFCQEVLPFVFIVKVDSNVTIDVRNNFVYQRIQGITVDEVSVVKEFESEFWRIWNEESTMSERAEVSKLLKAELDRFEQEH